MDPAQRIVEEAKRLRHLKDRKEIINDELKEINKLIIHLEQFQLPEMMSAAEIDKIKVEGIGTLFQQKICYAHIRVDDKEEAINWLDENGHGDIAKRTINAATLKSFCREMLDDFKPVPDFFNAKLAMVARLRRT